MRKRDKENVDETGKVVASPQLMPKTLEGAHRYTKGLTLRCPLGFDVECDIG